MKKTVLILFGGKSSEHDISIVSTFSCLKYFDEYLYNIVLVYIDNNGVWRLVKNHNIEQFLNTRSKLQKVQLGINNNVLYILKGRSYKPYKTIDVVFPIIHGVNGEDGCLAGLIKMSNLCYVGSDNISSAIGIDKSVFKKVCNVLPMLNFQVVHEMEMENENCVLEKIKDKIGFPCIIKPSKLGSSIGINLCQNIENLTNLIKKSLNFDKKVIIEPYVENLREFNIALFNYEDELLLSEIEEPILSEKILSFKDKYLNFSEQYNSKNIPAKINNKLKLEIEKVAKECYKVLGCSGVVRVDFIYDKVSKKLYLNEINTIPGSLALYLFEAKGMERKDVINKLIHEAIRQYQNEDRIVTNFKSNVLKNQNFSKFNNK